MYKWCHESRRNYTFVKLKATKISKRCVLFWSRGPDGYRKNDRKRAVVWPWLVLELSTVLALTQLGIRQSDWRRVGIRSTNLHIVVEYTTYRFDPVRSNPQGASSTNRDYRKISNIRCTKSPNLNVSLLVLQLSLPNPMKLGGVNSRMKM